jgi:hypothetical protein
VIVADVADVETAPPASVEKHWVKLLFVKTKLIVDIVEIAPPLEDEHFEKEEFKMLKEPEDPVTEL